MKLLRYGDPGAERPAVIPAGSGVALDATSVTSGYEPDFFASDGLERLRAAVADGALPEVDIAGRRVGAPIARPGKIICIGLNYRNHAAESGMAIPDEPIIFMKAPNTVIGPNDDVRIPRRSEKTDWEVELAVVVGRTASYI
jgi:2-keto-4-pentenoate hydratase/2-oxohepta-3-ene-1,7-dioic acid hydratase in catechol pathway